MKRIFVIAMILISGNSFSQNEPWKRPLKISTGTDGQTFSNIQTFQDSAGVPSIVKLSSGVLISAFQWFRQPVGSASWDRVAVKFSSDNGATWTQPAPIIVTDLPQNFTRPFDPALAVTDSGRIRMYFSTGLNQILDTSINTYSATSTDGVNYTMDPGFRFSLPDRPVIDPAIIKFRNLWHLVNPATMGQTGAYHNISGDGLNFNRVQDIQSDQSHSWIGNFTIIDTNTLRFYGSGMNIWYSVSTNGGVWSSFTNTNIIGGDPAVLKLSTDNYLMIYTGPPYTVSISENTSSLDKFELFQNFPNPFNPRTVIRYSILSNVRGQMSEVKITVYDYLGKIISELVNEKQTAGTYEVIFDGTNLPSGVYYYTFHSREFSETRRMMLIK